MRWKKMSRDDQKHVSSGGLYVYQDPKEEQKWMRVGRYGTCPQVSRAFGWMDYA